MPSPVETLALDERPESVPAAEPVGACELPGADAGRVAWTRDRLVTEDAAGALADTFRVLGDPTRVRLIDALSHGELCVCDLAAVIGLSESAVSHQLRLLRSMRLVRARKSGRQVFYALDDHHILDLFAQGRRHVEEHAPRAPRPRDPGTGAGNLGESTPERASGPAVRR